VKKDNTPNGSAGKRILSVVSIGSFLTPFMSSSVNIVLPAIGSEFSAGNILLSWVASSFLLSAAVFLVPCGRIADIWGRRKVYLWGLALYTLASLSASLSGSIAVLILSRILQGAGGAMILGTGIALVTSAFPPGTRGRALGIVISATYLGLSMGPVLGGLLSQRLGWRSIFTANVPLGTIVFALMMWKVKGEWKGAVGETLDRTGSLLYGLALAAFMYGLSLLPYPLGAALVLLGLAAGFLFVRLELRLEHPVFELRLLRGNAVFAFSNLAALINYSATFALGFLLSLYLQYIKALTPQQTGLVLVSQPLIMAVFSPLAGRLSDRTEPRTIASLGMGLGVLGLATLSFLNARTSLAFIVGSLILLGLGFALFTSPNTNAVMSSVGKQHFGIASATLSTVRLIGQMLSLGITQLIFSLLMGRAQITPGSYPGFLLAVRTAFLVFSFLCAAGVYASLARGSRR